MRGKVVNYYSIDINIHNELNSNYLMSSAALAMLNSYIFMRAEDLCALKSIRSIFNHDSRA
jgi:hypothetical protein